MKHTVTLLAALSLARWPRSTLPTRPRPPPEHQHRPLPDRRPGLARLGCHGSTFYQTPNIDRLAREGVRFTDAYAACTVCSPTRAAMLTGKYPGAAAADRLDAVGPLESQGASCRAGDWSRTAAGGSHAGRSACARPAIARPASASGTSAASRSPAGASGFDVNIGGNAHGAPGSYFCPYAGDWAIPNTGLRATWNVLPDGKPGEYLTDRLTDEAVKFIRENREHRSSSTSRTTASTRRCRRSRR